MSSGWRGMSKFGEAGRQVSRPVQQVYQDEKPRDAVRTDFAGERLCKYKRPVFCANGKTRLFSCFLMLFFVSRCTHGRCAHDLLATFVSRKNSASPFRPREPAVVWAAVATEPAAHSFRLAMPRKTPA